MRLRNESRRNEHRLSYMQNGVLFFFVHFESVLGVVLQLLIALEEVEVGGWRIRVGHIADK